MIFNQFDELRNHLWHYAVTGRAAEEVFEEIAPGDRVAGSVRSSGSAGTLGAGYYLKDRFPGAKVAVAEALQCPTLLENGFGDHRIEGIGDKHVPWIHNLRDTDVVIAVDDELPMRLIRLFNEEAGGRLLAEAGVPEEIAGRLDLLGISGVGNLVAAMKFAKYFELDGVRLGVHGGSPTPWTSTARGSTSSRRSGAVPRARGSSGTSSCLRGIPIDHMQELTYYEQKAIHNLKYFTWVEQQGRDVAELRAQWDDHAQLLGRHLRPGRPHRRGDHRFQPASRPRKR